MFLYFIASYPFIWAIGIAIIFWPVLLILFRGELINCRQSFISNSLFLIGLIEIISIPIGILSFQVGLDRILSAIVNGLIWICTSFLVSYKFSDSDLIRLRKILIGIGISQGVIVFIARMTLPQVLPIPLLHNSMKIFGANSAAFSNNQVVYVDWLNGFTLRTHGIMANATWAGGFSAVAIILLLSNQSLSIGALARNAVKYSLLIFVVYLSLSRSVMIALLFSIASGLILKLSQNANPQSQIAIVSLIAIFIVSAAVLIISGNYFNIFFESINQTRSGSLESRSDIYRITVELIREHPFPIIGYGVKPSGEGLVASIATHSTPLGILFKAGLLGLLIYVFFVIASFKKLISTRNWLGFSIMTFIFLWSLLEDFDGGHLIPIFLVLVFQPKLNKMLRDNLT